MSEEEKKKSNWIIILDRMLCVNVGNMRVMKIEYEDGKLWSLYECPQDRWNQWYIMVDEIRDEYLRVVEIETEKILLGADREGK